LKGFAHFAEIEHIWVFSPCCLICLYWTCLAHWSTHVISFSSNQGCLSL